MRIALGIAYQGSAYSGWQIQKNQATIQGHVEFALSQIANHSVNTICAGRTDAGVHATGQTIHFDTHSQRLSNDWITGSNRFLPKDISVCWVKQVDSSFHARFTALAREYKYIICNQTVRPALHHLHTIWESRPLDEGLMAEAAHHLLGTHDFTSFRASGCQAHSAIRTLYSADVIRNQNFIIITIKANAFLYHMVRNIVGVLMAIGRKEKPPSWVQDLLQAQDRRIAAVKVPASGLYFTKVDYPPMYNLPYFPQAISLFI